MFDLKDGDRLRQAAWVARCVGRAPQVPLAVGDLQSLTEHLTVRELRSGERLYAAGHAPAGICIVRHGRLELAVPRPDGRHVLQTLLPGDVEGDVPLLLGIPTLYEARARERSVCLTLAATSFDKLLAEHPLLTRRWLTSIAERLARAQARLAMLLGRPLPIQVAQLLLDEHLDGVVALPQSTLAAMLGATRPAVNKVLKDMERRGLVTLEYGRVRLVDRDGLARINVADRDG